MTKDDVQKIQYIDQTEEIKQIHYDYLFMNLEQEIQIVAEEQQNIGGRFRIELIFKLKSIRRKLRTSVITVSLMRYLKPNTIAQSVRPV